MFKKNLETDDLATLMIVLMRKFREIQKKKKNNEKLITAAKIFKNRIKKKNMKRRMIKSRK